MTEMLTAVKEFIKPELMVLIPVIFFIGCALKKSQHVPDKNIPIVLGLCGVFLAFVWVGATCTMASTQDWFLAVFTAVVQGILCAGCSVYINQLMVQNKKDQ